MAERESIRQLNFLRLLERRIEGTSEDALVEAYEEGRLALERGASFLDLVGAFGDALLARLPMDDTADVAAVVRAAVDIVGEASVPFQMTIEGYRTAIAELEQANRHLEEAKEELEDRVRERTAELEAAKAFAEAASRAKSDFLSRMSHELRTPLNAVLGFAQLLGLDDLTTDQRDKVTDILHGGRRLLDLINEVLDLARIEAGHPVLLMEPVLVHDVVTESLALLAPLAAQHDVSLHVSPASDRDLHACADRQRLSQVVVNLVSNAVKYNRPGGDVTVAWTLIPPTGVRLVVHDTGIGIAPPLIARLFQPFERLEASPPSKEPASDWRCAEAWSTRWAAGSESRASRAEARRSPSTSTLTPNRRIESVRPIPPTGCSGTFPYPSRSSTSRTTSPTHASLGTSSAAYPVWRYASPRTEASRSTWRSGISPD